MMWWGLTVCGVCYMYNVCDVARSYRMWYGVVLHVHCLVWCYMYNVCDVVGSYRMWCVLHVQCVRCSEVLPYVVWCGVTCTWCGVTCTMCVMWWGLTVCGVLHVQCV